MWFTLNPTEKELAELGVAGQKLVSQKKAGHLPFSQRLLQLAVQTRCYFEANKNALQTLYQTFLYLTFWLSKYQ